ncbi:MULTISPECIES: LPP20 family lipoprotein [Butyricimonas]|uniref:LPP20 family lipoprotein n=1 Tax=Butyricimonas TaxID=574697 RepID=UPI001D068A0B|nr:MULTISPECIES: LPP20 family lipoprotein [Butyricimonas]MCB6970588.1 LPP20 family lipoprotein [Butyricimonas synergistica]MCG4517302.1 LPP20 family lipoprotein [Butyricimonas sp. DFI.6.44]
MRKIILSLLLSVYGVFQAGAQEPEWVNKRPTSPDMYIGIGMASLTETDYMKKATQNALLDIVSQIAIKLENNSFLHRVDVDGKSREMFEDKIHGSLVAWIEGQELKDTYQSGQKYYVYYVLDKNVYARKAEERRQQAIKTGMDYLQKGRAAEEAMNLTQAVQLYGKGLEAAEPWVFMDLTTDEGGRSVNVPVELYNAYMNVFSGMAITTNVVQVEGEAFKAVAEPIAGCLSKNGVVVPNVKLKASFVSGSGAVSPAIQTDHTGTAEFYVTNITSKEDVQELRVSIDESFTDALPAAYRRLLQNQTWPAAKVSILLKSAPITAYLYVNDNDLEGCERHISSLLTNNYFTLSEDPDAPQCFVDLSTKMEMGETVTGGIYDLNACYCTLVLKIYNNKNQQMLLNYSVNRVKVLVPISKSAEETISMCVREVMKRVNRELPDRIKKLKIN